MSVLHGEAWASVPPDPGLTGIPLALQGFAGPSTTPPFGLDFTDGVLLTPGK